MAETYLKLQHQLWPELVRTKLLPAMNEQNINRFAEEFKQRFLADVEDDVEPLPVKQSGKVIGSAYLRYSDENSNSRSLSQQLRNILQRAK